jgi:hypothetical protein
MVGTKSIAKEPVSFLQVWLFLFVSIFPRKKVSFGETCVFLFIALCPIGDFMLQGTQLRGFGASLSIFPLCGLAILGIEEWVLSAKMSVSPNVLIILSYVLITALYGLLYFGISSQGENLIWRGITSLINLFAFIFAATLNYSNRQIVRRAIYVALAFVLLGFFFGNSNPLGLPVLAENGVLHFTPLIDDRPRGLASEPSMFSITAVVIGLLSVHVAKSRSGKILLFVLTIGLLIASGSKGGLLMLFICAIILSVMRWHSKWYHVGALLFVFFPLGVALIWLVPTLFPENSLLTFSTVPTRVSMVLCALMTVMHHPFGVGLPGFLPAVAKYLPNAITTVESISPVSLNFGEVSDYLTSADMVSTKTFFFDQLMRFGIPFACVFVLFVTQLLRRLAEQKQTILMVAVLASAIAMTTYIVGVGNFAIAILFGIAINEVRNGPNSLRVERLSVSPA